MVRLGPTGSDNVSATLLRTALLSHFQSDHAMTDAAASLSISNKYFSAKVVLQDIGTARPENSKEDGIILVFDALLSNPDRPVSGGNATFDSLTFAHEQVVENHDAGDLLRLCVGVTLTPPSSPQELRGQKNADEEYSRRILWCLDRGYEYVEADISSEGQAKGHDERDKEGFARIVEAIQGTVWSSAVMSQRKTQELKATYQEDRVLAEEAVVPTSGKDEIPLEENSNSYEPPDPEQMKTFVTTPISDQQVSEMILDPENVGPAEMAQVRKDLEADKLFEQMEGVLKEASRIREASKKGTIPDEERRDRAGDAAMALVNLMKQFGLDEEGSQGGDDDSSLEDDGDSGIVANK